MPTKLSHFLATLSPKQSSEDSTMESVPPVPPEDSFALHEILPPEVWELIFLSLEASELALVRLTCVRWRDIVDLAPALAERFMVTFPKSLWMDWRYDPGTNLYRRARNAHLEDCTIVSVDHWWPELAQRLSRLELVNCTLQFRVLLGMLREAPNLRQLHLDVNIPRDKGDQWGWSTDDNEPDFNLPRLEQLKASFANRTLGRICGPNLKLFCQLDSEDPQEDFEDFGRFLAETQGSLVGLVFRLTPKLLEEMARMERLRLQRIKITNHCEARLVVRLSRLQPDIRDIEIANTVLTGEELSQLGRNLPHLMSLSATVKPSPRDVDLVHSTYRPSYLRFMPSLEVLSVYHVDLPELLDFGGLPGNRRLKELSLNDIPDCVRLKEYLGRCDGLQRLDMHACILDSWAEVFGAVQQARESLQILSLSCIRVADGWDCLADGDGWVGRLEHLALRACDVSKGMLLHLIAVCPRLRQVQLGLMGAVDDAVVLAACLGLPRLAMLIVFRCGAVTDESVGSLIRFGGDALKYVAILDCEKVTAEANAKLATCGRFRAWNGK